MEQTGASELLDRIENKLQTGDTAAAAALMERCGQTETGTARYWNLHGVWQCYTGNEEDAVRSFRRAVELDENDVDSYKNLVDLLERRPAPDVVYFHTENLKTPEPGNSLYESRQNVAEAYGGENAPLVDILVLAYNRLERTKRCVECILKYTQGINYHLILVDNGSDEPVLDYFRAVPHPKKTVLRVTKNIGAGFGGVICAPYCRGRYFVSIPNDVYVTQNWLANMLRCAQSDPRIGMVAAMSSNVSNLQNPGLKYAGFEEMQRKAAAFNRPDPRKWQERLRLITICTLFKRECKDIVGESDCGFFHDFTDDDFSFRVRRAGYKAVLCGDTFVCHDHDVFHGDGKDSATFEQSLWLGRGEFKQKHFVDAWDDVNQYEGNLLSLAGCETYAAGAAPRILGVDVRCGTPILELKNRFRLAGVTDACLSAFTTDAKYYADLKTVCDGEVLCDRIEYLSQSFAAASFDYVVLGREINACQQRVETLLEQIRVLLRPGGTALVKLQNPFDLSSAKNLLRQIPAGQSAQMTTPELFLETARRAGFASGGILTELRPADSRVLRKLQDACGLLGLSLSPEDIKRTFYSKCCDISLKKK